MIRLAFLLAVLFSLQGCSTTPVPIDDYNLAKTALEASRVVQAGRYSPGYWSEAEDSFNMAVISYKEQDYEKAKLLFIKARIAAEKAENSARLIRQKNGDTL